MFGFYFTSIILLWRLFLSFFISFCFLFWDYNLIFRRRQYTRMTRQKFKKSWAEKLGVDGGTCKKPAKSARLTTCSQSSVIWPLFVWIFIFYFFLLYNFLNLKQNIKKHLSDMNLFWFNLAYSWLLNLKKLKQKKTEIKKTDNQPIIRSSAACLFLNFLVLFILKILHWYFPLVSTFFCCHVAMLACYP